MTEPVSTPDDGDAEYVVKAKRSATLVFTQAVLMLEAFCALFAMLLVWGLTRGGMLDVPVGWTIGGGLTLVALMAWAAGKQEKSWGRPLGWALQIPLLVAGFLDTAITIIGVIFLGIWILALRLGTKIDRERAQYDDDHPGEVPPVDQGRRA
ncbi:DUF4233 domain-containing protein [Demequina sp. B12]|uniref:DUF4233 domain-containing protein n=1 Tax=Demequina sp. B12 TaxID=2992757 RepID=UPI00237A651D|nr:DUF4233 domain-containing protein [Demequina sp. B12]MDE0573443.1 DUF4233 domain-containing protein [Demequina sp. B12]